MPGNTEPTPHPRVHTTRPVDEGIHAWVNREHLILSKVSTSKIIQKCRALSEYLETNDTIAIPHSLLNVLGG